MADKADIVLEEETIKLLRTGSSPVVDIEGGHWNLAESDGDLRIGDAENMLKMGVAIGGGGAGNARLWATSDLRLGSREESIVAIDDQGVHPHDGEYSLGTADNRWVLANLGLLDVEAVSSDLVPYYEVSQIEAPDEDQGLNLGSETAPWHTLWTGLVETREVNARGEVSVGSHLNVDGEVYADGNLTLTGDGGDFTGRAIVQELSVSEGAFTIEPFGSGQNLGASDNPWDTVYTDHAEVTESSVASDRRLKTDIEDIEYGIDAVLDLRPVSFSWRDNGDGTRLGLIGQEVEQVLPEAVRERDDEDGTLGLDYSEVVAVLVEAVQDHHAVTEEQTARVDRQAEAIESQQERIEAQEERIETQQERIETQEAQIEAQQERIEAQDERIGDQQEQIEHQRARIDALEERLAALE